MIPASVSIVREGFPGCSICSTTIDVAHRWPPVPVLAQDGLRVARGRAERREGRAAVHETGAERDLRAGVQREDLAVLEAAAGGDAADLLRVVRVVAVDLRGIGLADPLRLVPVDADEVAEDLLVRATVAAICSRACCPY